MIRLKYIKKFTKLKDYLPFNSFARRNIGDLLAYEEGFSTIIRVDDDNYPTDDDFIEYEDLTKNQVLGWAQTAISERVKSTDTDGVQTNLGIDSIKILLHNTLLVAHIETTGLPWE